MNEQVWIIQWKESEGSNFGKYYPFRIFGNIWWTKCKNMLNMQLKSLKDEGMIVRKKLVYKSDIE